MRHTILAAALLVVPAIGHADDATSVIENLVETHVLPRFDALAETSQVLAEVVAEDCAPTSDTLRSAYGAAFDAWVSASHLRFGPTEVDDRAFALALWPDSRGAMPRVLSGLIADQDSIGFSVDDYGDVSIAARGFYAMEFLLYDDVLMTAGDQAYHCALIQTIGADIANTTQQILNDWTPDYAAAMQQPDPEGAYRNEDEVLKEMFKALTTGLQFTSETRLGRPLGTFERPRPTRAEVRLSGRSAEHVRLSLIALRDLASGLALGDAELAAELDAGFDDALSRLAALDDPVFASVSVPQTRLKVEIVQQSIETIRALVRDELGPTIGVAAGFNSLDGD